MGWGHLTVFMKAFWHSTKSSLLKSWPLGVG
jgi:hypothetical protein